MLLASPSSRETASLYITDKEYEELDQLVRAVDKATAKPPEADLMAAHQINVTWMAHDVTPWRLDRIHGMADGRDVWIHTAVGFDQPTKGTWHRAEHPAQLRTLLKELGVMGKPSAGESTATDGTDRTTEPPLTQSSSSGDGTDWWWALPGAAAGAVLALVLRPFSARLPWDRLRGGPGPRQELRDV